MKKFIFLFLVLACLAGVVAANLGERRVYPLRPGIKYLFTGSRDPNNFWDDVNDVYILNGLLDVLDINITGDLDVNDVNVAGDLTLEALTASRLLYLDADSNVASVADFTAWIAGTANQIIVTDPDTDGTVTLSLPQDYDTGATPTLGGLTITGNSVFGLNSSVFQPATDSTTFFQVNDQDGNDIFTVDTIDRKVIFDCGDGTAARNLFLVSDVGSTFFPGFGLQQGAGTNIGMIISGGGTIRFQRRDSDGGNAKNIISTHNSGGCSIGHTYSVTDPGDNKMIIGGSITLKSNNYEDFIILDRTDAVGVDQLVYLTPSSGPADNTQFRVNIGTDGAQLVIGENYFIGIGNEKAPETLTEWTHATPYLTLHNSTHEDSDGGRESRINFKGEQGVDPFEKTTLARIEVGHDGAGADDKGYLDIFINDGDDGDSPTKRIRIDSDGTFSTLFGRILKTNRLIGNTTLDATYHQVFADTDGGAFTVTLPVGITGTEYRIINTGSSANNLTITPDGAELLLGVNVSWILFDGEALTIVYEATEGWF